MFFVKLLLWIITLPIVIVAYLLRLFFMILVSIGHGIARFIGGASMIIGVISFFMEDITVGMSIGAIVFGAVVFALPYIGVFLVDLLDALIAKLKSLSFA